MTRKTLLITGGAGFVGSTLAIFFKTNYPTYSVIALDNLRRRGSELNLPRLRDAGVTFVHGDVRNSEDLTSLPRIDTIIEASADASVLAGVGGDPDYVVNTNLLGTANCLRLARKDNADFIFLSTSRVYPIAELDKILFDESPRRFDIASGQSVAGVSERGISEDFPLAGSRSFYGATKLCSEILIEEYRAFYGIRTVVNRCGLIAGPWQMGKVDQGVVALWMARHVFGGSLRYVGFGGEGKQIRDVLHVDDLCLLVDHQLNDLEAVNGQTYNVGGGAEFSVSLRELTDLCESITGKKIEIGSDTAERPADIRIYVTDNSKVTGATGWSPKTGLDQTLTEIYHWLMANEDSVAPVLQ